MSRRPILVRSEGGFTLVEVLTVIAVLGIISLPLANSMMVGLRTSDRTAKILVTSADRQMLTNYLSPDALSANTATTDGAATGGCLTADGTRVLLLTWTEFDGASTSYVSDYRLVPNASGKKLVRDRCTPGSGADETTVIHDAAAASATITGGKVAIQITDSLGAQYQVSGTRRAA